MGPQYAGTKISREALLDDDDTSDEHEEDVKAGENVVKYADPEDFDLEVDEEAEIDSDEALGESDQEKFRDFAFRGSKRPKDSKKIKKRPMAADFMSDRDNEDMALNGYAEEDEETDEDILDVDRQHAESLEDGEGASDDEQDSDEESDEENPAQSGDESVPSDEESDEALEDDEDEQERRAELRKIMGEEQRSVVVTISQAAKADTDKGNAVKQQRKAFDSLLNARIRLQKALVATNSMAVAEEKDLEDNEENPYQAAEEAAVKLWNTLDGIRHELSRANKITKTGQKRKRSIDSSTPSPTIWERMQNSEIANIDLRQSTLEKWSAKVRGTSALPLSRKLNPTAAQQSITSVLLDQLASSTHLIQRTKIPRSCAPLQAKQKVTSDPNIFDDADFYQMLLKELLDQRMVDSTSAPVVGENGRPMQWTAVKEAKTRKNVDTKASKGRKIRFTVHEKLQNFMAPEDRTSWEQSATDRLFGTLLGQKMSLGETEEGGASDGEEELGAEEALMLFRS